MGRNRGNRSVTADGVLWQPRLGWDMLIPLVPVIVGVVPAFVDVGWVRYAIIASVVLFVLMFVYFLRQKLVIKPQGPALMGLFGTRRVAWVDIAAIEIRPHFDNMCYVTMRYTMRNGSRRRHVLSYLAFEAVRDLVGDLRTHAAPHGIPVSVTGSPIDRRTAGEPVDADI
ncbi:hypothetical protein [Embleya sp. NPDC020886]|uniref:hypothetical protein n=1 Tax=Embleya sp. NPDC020886 TaxID=3363980 RepID=UPI0037A066AE